ncbi:MAG: hypothetical protein OIF32_04405 [Campylobacterales bacterium]|nr:hypothetical protein [Campylobacterales bacterium]
MKYLLLPLLFISILQAVTLTKEYRYMASDTDSKASSRAQALKTIENMTIDEVGSGVALEFSKEQEISDEAIKRELTLSIRNFATSLVTSKILEEKWNGESYWVKASIAIDDTAIVEKLKAQYQALENSSKSRAILKMLKNINTKKQIDKLVNKAVTLPFSQDKNDNAHMEILKVFYRYKIYHGKYREFLLTTLKNIEFPSWDTRTTPILTYLSRSQPFDEEDQKILLNLLSYVEVGRSGFYLEKILRGNLQVCDKSVEKFLKSYLTMVENNQAGLPVYTNIQNEIGTIPRIWSNLRDNRKCPLLGIEAVTDFLEDSDHKKNITDKQWLDLSRKVINNYPRNQESSEEFLEFLELSIPNIPEERISLGLIQKLYSRSVPTTQEKLTDKFEEKIVKIYLNTKIYERDIEFAIKHSIVVPNKVFELESYYDMVFNELASRNRTSYIKAILAFDKKNLQESRFFQVLEFLYKDKDYYNLDIILPIIKDTEYNKDIITLLFKSTRANNGNLSRKAKKYLIEKSNVESLLEIASSLTKKEKKDLIVFLHHYKKETVKSLPKIKSMFEKSKYRDILFSLEWLEKNLKRNGHL